jgi:tRNA A37 threonylcarbamoyladenosine modification protein TsaB
MILYIDTTEYDKVTFAFTHSSPLKGEARRGWKVIRKSYKINPHQSNETLQKLEEFLKSIKYKVESTRLDSTVEPRRIKKILVNKGPGSFTGVRVGVTHALALGYAWGIPVNALPKEKFDKALSKI